MNRTVNCDQVAWMLAAIGSVVLTDGDPLVRSVIAANRFDLLDHDLDDDGRIVYRMRERVAA